ncbi:MAG: TonB-dependent receptor [Betaproteobacteria bacterium]|nr:TonB-dependent receptor [Betaproteobacteria bacterium]
MKQKKNVQRATGHAAVAFFAWISATSANATDQTYDLGAVSTAGGSDTATLPVTGKGSATYESPSSMSTKATEPVFNVGQQYIEQNAGAGSNYTDIISILPSVVSVDPNGAGMMETQALSIRGFQDGQYNVTFDGIPWGDSNDFTHHSTSYFMAQDLGGIAVDMGPGDASNIGYSTFGGTVAVKSRDPIGAAQTNMFSSFGSWNTRLLGAQFNSGNMQNYGDSMLYLSYKDFSSNGYLTNSSQKRQNLFMKFEKPLNEDTLITFVAMGNKLQQNVPYGASLQQMAKYGKNYGLSSNPLSQDYYGYNNDNITSDFEYIGVKTRYGSLDIDNKLYTYAYYHDPGLNGLQPGYGTNLGTGNAPGTPGLAVTGTVVGGVAYPNDIPGQTMTMNYRSVGDLLRMSEDMGPGKLDFGAWIDVQNNNRSQSEIDFSLGGAPNSGNQIYAPTGNLAYTDRLMMDSLTTLQPYLQYEWKVMDNWTVTPGVKYSYFERSFNSLVQQGTGQPYNGSQSWTKALPALTTNYLMSKNWSFYAEYAEGFMAPNMNNFFKPNAQTGNLQPQSTKNYQVGTVWTSRNVNLSADLYHIDFTNKISAISCGVGVIGTCFTNIGGVTYDGGEMQGTWMFAKNISLYGNVGINNYSTSDGSILPYTPHTTAALGPIYDDGAWYGSLIAKEVGARSSGTGNGGPNNNGIAFGSYTLVDLNTSYKFDTGWNWAKKAQVGFQISNLFNRTDIYAYTSGFTDINGNPLLFGLPERFYQVNFSVIF